MGSDKAEKWVAETGPIQIDEFLVVRPNIFAKVYRSPRSQMFALGANYRFGGFLQF